MKSLFRRQADAIARKECGSQVAELAMVFPILLMVFMGILWFGRAFNIYTTLNRAAREAAEAKAEHACTTCGNAVETNAEIKDRVITPILTAAHLDPAQLQNYQIIKVVPSLNPSSSPPVDGFEASMSYPYSFRLNGVTCCPFSLAPINLGVLIQAKSRAQEEN